MAIKNVGPVCPHIVLGNGKYLMPVRMVLADKDIQPKVAIGFVELEEAAEVGTPHTEVNYEKSQVVILFKDRRAVQSLQEALYEAYNTFKRVDKENDFRFNYVKRSHILTGDHMSLLGFYARIDTIVKDKQTYYGLDFRGRDYGYTRSYKSFWSAARQTYKELVKYKINTTLCNFVESEE